MKVEYPDPKHPDMSSEAIQERLRMVEALRKLGVALKEAGERGPIGNAKTTPTNETDGRLASSPNS